ncbi:hypothetical protein F1188_11050 [Roseospira marina]|uniref:Uncharacterized protein n=1 Tax=Roseospira marina TaxID=140057 RepID=A0A5M6IB21_9PROT|nr:hypothetical protein [Roseospira marina]KAA5605431.1 hypothetical protein F1188_11050 [Roseospira marina]MBB4314574.1 hypothetical protein [Roseospira marina]MBB5088864.1 hypothetical protein [Roseospira marina]
MAAVTTYREYKTDLPHVVGGVSTVFWEKLLAANAADSGDTIECFDLPGGARITDCSMSVGGTLGAGCTAALKVGATALTSATTAGGADTERMSVHPPAASTSSQTVQIAIGGADIAASAAAKVMVQYVMDR